MTLISYDGDRLDQLSLRVFDVAATLRGMAATARAEGLSMSMHDKKALEWLANLEAWAKKVEADLNVERYSQQARALARDMPDPSRPARKKGASGRKASA